jgi:transcription elongation factor Elf1
LPWGYHAVRNTMPTRAHHLLDDVVHQKVVVRAAQPLLRHTVPCRARAARSHTRMKLRTAPIRSVMQHATLHMQCATCNMQRATCNAQNATCNMQCATCKAQHATHGRSDSRAASAPRYSTAAPAAAMTRQRQ